MSDKALKMYITAEAGVSGNWEFIEPTSVLIGRSSNCNIHPPLENEFLELSRFHALIEWDGETAQLADLGSLNGTWLNCHLIGRRATGDETGLCFYRRAIEQDVKLQDGDLIVLGPLWLRVFIKNAQEEVFSVKSEECSGCGQKLKEAENISSPDALCEKCRPNPLAALRLLQSGLKRRIPILDPLKSIRVEEILGKGATSAVFRVSNKKTSQQFALKVMPPSISNNNWARKSFLREAALGRALRHSNVISLYDYGHYAGAHFVLMEYCLGGSSEEERVNAGGKLSVERSLSIILQVLDGLDFLHNVKLSTNLSEDDEMQRSTRGLIHRDIKPANIFLGGASGLIPKIADIGVAKFNLQGGSCDTRTGTVAGSPATMPRQQAMDFKNAGPEVDVWAAAASLYKLLTGEYPRDFPPDVDPWQIVMNERPRALLSLLPDAPRNLAETLDNALIDESDISALTAIKFKEDLLKAIERDDIWI